MKYLVTVPYGYEITYLTEADSPEAAKHNTGQYIWGKHLDDPSFCISGEDLLDAGEDQAAWKAEALR